MKCNCGTPAEHAKRKQAFDDWWNGRITADEFERIMGWK